MTDIAEIAQKLTKAQRGCLEEVAMAGPDGLGFGHSASFMRRRLIAMGLTERLPARSFTIVREVLTPRGTAVRKHLKGEPS